MRERPNSGLRPWRRFARPLCGSLSAIFERLSTRHQASGPENYAGASREHISQKGGQIKPSWTSWGSVTPPISAGSLKRCAANHLRISGRHTDLELTLSSRRVRNGLTNSEAPFIASKRQSSFLSRFYNFVAFLQCFGIEQPDHGINVPDNPKRHKLSRSSYQPLAVDRNVWVCGVWSEAMPGNADDWVAGVVSQVHSDKRSGMK